MERMEVLCDLLGRPQDRFDSAHVVGTNGKTSVTRISAAMLAEEGRSTGWLTSPHFESWGERVQVAGPGAPELDFQSAVEATAGACAEVVARLPEAGHPTQFEVSVAAGLLALAEAGVEVAVIEAGLGGRLDATNVIESKVTALVSVGLDHTEWLGNDELAIATEKLAVLTPGTSLVIGPLSPEVETLAVETADRLECELIPVSTPGEGGFPALNRAVAGEVAAVMLGRPVGEQARAIAGGHSVKGRLERVSTEPDVYFDVAHNRPGARALAGILPSLAGGRPVIGCLGVASDKDSEGMIEELAPGLAALVATVPGAVSGSPPGRQPTEPGTLAKTASRLGVDAEVVPDPTEAIRRASERARSCDGMVLVFGSHSLFSALDQDA